MRKIRIGKDIRVRWRILTNGEALPLEGRDLRLEMVNRFGRTERSFSMEDDNVVVFTFPGTAQRYLGEHTFTLWENRGKPGQTVVDSCDGVELVKSTCMEGGTDGKTAADTSDLSTESLELAASSLDTMDDYYTKEESDGKFQLKGDPALSTSDKTVVGAINETYGTLKRDDEHLFDTDPKYSSFYSTDDGKIWYIAEGGVLCSFDETSREVVRYEKIREQQHPTPGNPAPTAKRHVVRGGRVLLFAQDRAMPLKCYDLATQELLYETALPDGYDTNAVYYGFLVEYKGMVFMCDGLSPSSHLCRLDFDSGAIIKDYGLMAFRGSVNQVWFSWQEEGYSLFAAVGKIVKYDEAQDTFTVVVDGTSGSPDINTTKGAVSAVYPCRVQNAVLIFNYGLCVMLKEDILAGRYDSTKNFTPIAGLSPSGLNPAFPPALFGDNVFVNHASAYYVTNNHGYPHTFGATALADPERMGYFVKGKYGYVMFRSSNSYVYEGTMSPIYRRYNTMLH